MLAKKKSKRNTLSLEIEETSAAPLPIEEMSSFEIAQEIDRLQNIYEEKLQQEKAQESKVSPEDFKALQAELCVGVVIEHHILLECLSISYNVLNRF